MTANVIGIAMILLGSIVMLITLFEWLKKVIDIKLFKKTVGIVVKSEIFPRYSFNDYSTRPPSLRELTIAYQYEIKGKTYKSQTVTKKELFIFNRVNYLEKYPVDEKVDVFYDPQKPKTSILELDTNFETYLFMLLLSLGFFYGGYRFIYYGS